MNHFIEETYQLYEDRKQEVDQHLRFVEVLIKSKANRLAVYNNECQEVVDDAVIDRDLVKTVLATGYLLIYNLIESVTVSALGAVHKQIKEDGLSCSELNQKLQKVYFKNFKDTIGYENHPKYKAFKLDKAIVCSSQYNNVLILSNVDAGKIKDKAVEYDIQLVYTGDDWKEVSAAFLEVKRQRNRLAHGDASFRDCGQSTPIDALINYNDQACKYLKVVIQCIDDYLLNRKYRIQSKC